MTANVLRILGMIAAPVSQRIGVLMHAAADNPYGQMAGRLPARNGRLLRRAR